MTFLHCVYDISRTIQTQTYRTKSSVDNPITISAKREACGKWSCAQIADVVCCHLADEQWRLIFMRGRDIVKLKTGLWKSRYWIKLPVDPCVSDWLYAFHSPLSINRHAVISADAGRSLTTQNASSVTFVNNDVHAATRSLTLVSYSCSIQVSPLCCQPFSSSLHVLADVG